MNVPAIAYQDLPLSVASMPHTLEHPVTTPLEIEQSSAERSKELELI